MYFCWGEGGTAQLGPHEDPPVGGWTKNGNVNPGLRLMQSLIIASEVHGKSFHSALPPRAARDMPQIT
jgi:hypothetical protein